MESPELTRNKPNEEDATKLTENENRPEPQEIKCSEKVSSEDVTIRHEVTTKNKRVSFHFGTRSSDSKNVVLSTIQNIYDSKTDEVDGNLVRNNSTRNRINKSAYIKLHRHSFSSTGNSTVDKLKGKYENIAKQTDSNSKANIAVRASANIDNTSPNSAKHISVDKQVRAEFEDANTQKSKSTEILKAEFINSLPSSTDLPETCKSPDQETGTSESRLLKTKSNIEKLQNNLSTKLSNDTIEKLRNKYSPASFGYPREITSLKVPKKVQFAEESSRIPVPTPRISLKTQLSEVENKEVQTTPEDVPLEQKTIEAVTVKLVSVPETLEQANPEQNPEKYLKTKDENSNVVAKEITSIDVVQPESEPPPNQLLIEQQQEKPLQTQANKPESEEVTTGIEIELTYDNICFAEPEAKHFIERRSSSEDSIDKVENFFSEIVMEKKPKEKKRSNSFRKIFPGGLFGRDKKKGDEGKTKQKKKDNAVFSDNAQNESQAFDRTSPHRHTIDNSYPRREAQRGNVSHQNSSSGPLYYYSPQTQYRKTDDVALRNRYTEMKGNNVGTFVPSQHPKYSPEDYVPMDNGLSKFENAQRTYMNINKYIDTSSSSSNTLESENRNCTYQNALIAQAEMLQLRENENRNQLRSGIPVNVNRRTSPGYPDNRFVKHSDSPEMFRESPPHAPDSQNLQLVKPKALIPINSERPLPNPYHNNQDKSDHSRNYENLANNKTLDRNLNVDNSKPYPHKSNLYGKAAVPPDKSSIRPVVVEDVYGTVFDSVVPPNQTQTIVDNLRSRSLSPQQSQRSGSNCSSPSYRNLSSPRSVEASKLRLPPNREKVDLQPRIRSPIPQAKISTDKIIATELLRKRSPTPVQEKSPVKLQRSPHVSPMRPASYQEINIYENSADNRPLQRDNRISQSNRSPIVTSNKVLAQSTPQRAQMDYVYANDVSPISRPLPSPREASSSECIRAAEWQRHQRELDKSPALENSQQITTDVMVHVNPEEEHYVNRSSLPPSVRRTPVQVSYPVQGLPSPRSLTSLNSIRPHTPIQQQSSPSPTPRSPEKQHMQQNVEAFYWRELRKLKDKEEQDLLRYRQQQFYVYGYVEDPVFSRRSRSVSPSMQRGRRSLSLPRDVRPMSGRQLPGHEPIPEGRPVIAKKPIVLPTEVAYGQVRQPLQRNLNFIRNTFERSTIGPIGVSRNPYENYPEARETKVYTPIFKRGSLTGNIGEPQYQMSKKVSFSGNRNTTNPSNWPTKNGFTKSPPTRRVEREASMDDEVFLPNSPRSPPNRKVEEIYVRNNIEVQTNLAKPPLAQNSPRSDAGYSSRVPRSEVDYVERRVQEAPRQRLEYARTDPKQVTVSNKVCDIYGQIHDPSQRSAGTQQGQSARQNYNSIQDFSERSGSSQPAYQNYGQIHNSSQRSAIYLQDQITPQNYGQILHDSNQRSVVPSQGHPVPQNYGQIKQVGYVYGQIQQNPTGGSPVVLRQSYHHLSAPQGNFVRGTRLTASVNDMYKRYPVENPRYQANVIYPSEKSGDAPYRPLPPVPQRKDSRTINARKMVRGYVPISDNESGSEAGEVQRILQSGTKQKNFSVIEEEWNSDGKSGRASGNESGGSRGENEGEVKSSRSRSARREDPRRHTLSGDQHYAMAGQGGPLSRTMDLEGQFPRGYPPSSNAMLFDDDPGIMSEVETSSTGFRRGGKQRSSLPVVRTPSKTLERPLGLVFLQYRNETKRALLPNEITSIDTVKALFVRSFPKQLSMEYLDSPLVKIYIHDSSKDMFYELEDVRSHLREIRDRSVLRLFESTDVSGGLPMGGVGIPGGVGHFEDPSYFSEPEFDSEYQHQHIHKSKGSTGKAAPYYMGSTTSLPRGGPLLRPYSPAVGALPPDRLKTLPAGAPPKPQRAYSSGASRASDGSSRPPDRFAPFQRPANPLFNLPDGYMSSPERGSRGYEDPYYSQYTSRSGSITPVIDEEVSDTELLDEQYSLYGVKLAPGGPRGVRPQFPGPAAPPYDTTRYRTFMQSRLRVEHMERQLANLTGLVQKALTQTPTPRDFLAPPGRDAYRSGDEFDKNSSSSSASLPDDSYLRSDSIKAPKLGKSSCHKSVSFEKSVSFSDEPPDMNSPKQHSPQHAADTKPPKPAIKSSTLPRTSSQEKDRLKPAPPPKPASLSPGQYDGRHIYRDLQLTPEMYNQLRGLQKKAKDLRAEVRNLRRMSQAQAHSVRETIRDTFIKIRAMLMAGGEQVWQAGMDQERVRLSRDEDLYKQEMLRLETDLTDLEASVEELRGNVINRKTRVNMSDVENMALVLSKSSKTVADLKLRFPGLQDSMKAFLSSEMDKVVREEKFLKEEPERLESALRRCKKLTGTLVTLKSYHSSRLASVQEQRLPCSTSAADGRISPSSITETPPVTPTSGQHSKPPSGARVGQIGFGGDGANASDSNQRPENALDALLDELQTFSKPHPATVNTQMPQASYSDSTPSDPPAIPVKGIPPSHSAHFGYPPMSEIGRKGSMDSASILPTQNLTVSTATGSLRRLHSYPSGSDTDNSPPIQPLRTQMDGKAFSKPPIPERNAELLQHIASGRRVPPPPPPRTSSKSPLASPTSPSLPPRSPATGLQHIQNVQNMTEKPQSQFEAATQNLGLGTLRRNVPNRSSMKDNKAQTLPRNIGSNLQIHTQAVPPAGELQNVSSSSCESVNSQDGTKKGSRKEELEQRHQELLKKQKALQEQYARLQQLQRGNNTLAVVPPPPDQLLKKTGSESNLLQKMGLQMATTQMTGSLTHLPSTTTNSTNTGSNVINTAASTNISQPTSTTTTTDTTTDNSSSSSTTTTSKVYETDIL